MRNTIIKVSTPGRHLPLFLVMHRCKCHFPPSFSSPFSLFPLSPFPKHIQKNTRTVVFPILSKRRQPNNKEGIPFSRFPFPLCWAYTSIKITASGKKKEGGLVPVCSGDLFLLCRASSSTTCGDSTETPLRSQAWRTDKQAAADARSYTALS